MQLTRFCTIITSSLLVASFFLEGFHVSAALHSARVTSVLRSDLAAHERRLAPLSSVIDRILVINLNSRHDRKLQILKELQRHVLDTIKVERIAGEVGKKQDFESLVWQGKLTHMGYESVLRKRTVSGHYLTAGAIGCLLSHKKAWERTAISGGTSLVLEDDVLLSSQFKSRLQIAMRELPDDFGLLYLADKAQTPDVIENSHEFSEHLFKMTRSYWGTYAYVISANAASALLREIYPLNVQADSYIQQVAVAFNLPVFRLKKNLVDTDNSPSRDSDAQLTKEPAKDSLRITRTLHVLFNEAEDILEYARHVVPGYTGGSNSQLRARNFFAESSEEVASRVDKSLGILDKDDRSLLLASSWKLMLHTTENISRKSVFFKYLRRPQSKALSLENVRFLMCMAISAEHGGLCIQDGFRFLRSIDSLLFDVEAAAALTHDGKLHTQLVYAHQGSKTYLSIFNKTINTINSGLTINDRIPILPWQLYRKKDPSSVLLFPRHIFDPIKYPERDCIQKDDITHTSQFGKFGMYAAGTKSSRARENAPIPKSLHFVWLSNSVPEYVVRLVSQWLRYHPKWHVHLWTEQNSRHFSSSGLVLKTSDLRQRSDILRLEAVYHYGGFYADMDFLIGKSLDSLLEQDDSTPILCHEDGYSTDLQSISNGFFGFPMRHEILERALLRLQDAQLNTTADINLHTGPRFLRRVVADDVGTVRLLNSTWMYPVTYGDREQLYQMGCIAKLDCLKHFPDSFAVHIWGVAQYLSRMKKTQGMLRSRPVSDLLNLFQKHNEM